MNCAVHGGAPFEHLSQGLGRSSQQKRGLLNVSAKSVNTAPIRLDSIRLAVPGQGPLGCLGGGPWLHPAQYRCRGSRGHGSQSSRGGGGKLCLQLFGRSFRPGLVFSEAAFVALAELVLVEAGRVMFSYFAVFAHLPGGVSSSLISGLGRGQLPGRGPLCAVRTIGCRVESGAVQRACMSAHW